MKVPDDEKKDKEVDILVYNPLAPDEKRVEKTLHLCNLYNSSTNVTLGHVWGNKICVTNRLGEEEWRPFTPEINQEHLIDLSDWELREDNIAKRMLLHECVFPKGVKYNLNKIPAEKNMIECNYDESSNFPFLFTLSFANHPEEYFDMVAIPHDRHPQNNFQTPLCYRHKKHKNVLYSHSGDLMTDLPKDNTFRSRMPNSLLHTLTMDGRAKNRNDKALTSGCVVFHAYQQRTLFELADTEPNICIVDKPPNNSNEYNIWVYHLPIRKDLLKDSTVVFLARFDIDRIEKKITWQFLKNPTFTSDKFNVGHKIVNNNNNNANTKGYKAGLDKFYEGLRVMSDKENVMKGDMIARGWKMSLTADREMTLARRGGKKEEEEEEEASSLEKFLLIVQEPLLADDRIRHFANGLAEFIDHQNRVCKKYLFHQNIKKFQDGFRYEGDYNDCRFSLPIAGGSVISNSSLIKLCKPIEGGDDLVKEFTDDLKTAKGAIVIASDTCNAADFPVVYQKLNACYIVVNNSVGDPKDEQSRPAIDQILNDTNAAMANIQQGPLSCVVGYFPNSHNCYFVRGFAKDSYDKFAFGRLLESYDDVLDLASSTRFDENLVLPLTYFCGSSKYSFVDHRGRSAFDVVMGEVKGEDVYSQLEDGAERWTKDELVRLTDENVALKEINNYICCLLAQMEVLFDAQCLRDVFDIAKEKLQRIGLVNKATRGDVLEMLRGKRREEEQLPLSSVTLAQYLRDGESMSLDFDMDWFLEELKKKKLLYGELSSESCYRVVNLVKKFVGGFNKQTTSFLRSATNVKRQFLSILVGKSFGCISSKSSYGKRGMDVKKIIQRDNVQTNVAFLGNVNKEKSEKEGVGDALDTLLTNSCSRHGYFLYTVQRQELIDAINLIAPEKKEEEEDEDIEEEEEERGRRDGSENVQSFLRMDKTGRFTRSDGDTLSGFLSVARKVDEDSAVDGYVFKYNNLPMIAIPILDEAVDIMKDGGKMLKYPWSTSVVGGNLDYARILLRKSMHSLIKITAPNKSIRLGEGSKEVGHLVMHMLSSAMNDFIEYQKATGAIDSYSDDSAFVNGLRGMAGLLLSVMASGAEKPLIPAYRTILINANGGDSRVKFNFSNGKYWLDQFVKIEPYLRLKGVCVKDNVISNVVCKVKRRCQTIKDTSKHTKRILDLKKKSDERDSRKWLWEHDMTRPLILSVVKKVMMMKKSDDDDDDATAARKIGIDDFVFEFEKNYLSSTSPSMYLTLPDSGRKLFVVAESTPNNDNDDDFAQLLARDDCDVDAIERETMKQIERNENVSGLKRVCLAGKVPKVDAEFVGKTLDLYQKLINECDVAGLSLNSKFFQVFDKLDKIFHAKKRDAIALERVWGEIESIAFDVAMRQNGIFYALIRKVLIKTVNVLLKEVCRHTDKDIAECNAYLAGNHASLDEKEKKNDLVSAMIDVRKARAIIFKAFLSLRNPRYETCHTPNVVKVLALCERLDDFVHVSTGVDEINNHFSDVQGGNEKIIADRVCKCMTRALNEKRYGSWKGDDEKKKKKRGGGEKVDDEYWFIECFELFDYFRKLRKAEKQQKVDAGVVHSLVKSILEGMESKNENNAKDYFKKIISASSCKWYKNMLKGCKETNEEIVSIDPNRLVAIQKGKKIELRPRFGSTMMVMERYLYQYIKQFIQSKSVRCMDADEKEQHATSVIDEEKRLLFKEISQDDGVEKMRDWLCQMNVYENINWGDLSKYLCFKP